MAANHQGQDSIAARITLSCKPDTLQNSTCSKSQKQTQLNQTDEGSISKSRGTITKGDPETHGTNSFTRTWDFIGGTLDITQQDKAKLGTAVSD